MSQDTNAQDPHHRFGQDDDGDEGPSPPSYEEAISQDLSSVAEQPESDSRTLDDPLQNLDQGGASPSSFTLPSAPGSAQVQQPSAPLPPPSSGDAGSTTGTEAAPLNHGDTHSAHQSLQHPSSFGHHQGPFLPHQQHHDPLAQFQDPFMRHRHHQHPLAHPQLHQGPYKHPSFAYGQGPSASSPSPFSFAPPATPPSSSETSGGASRTAPATSESSFSGRGDFGGMPAPPSSSFPSFPPQFPSFTSLPFGNQVPSFPGFGRGPLPEGGMPMFGPGMMGPGSMGSTMGPMPGFSPSGMHPAMHPGFMGPMPTASPAHFPPTSDADQTNHIPTGSVSGPSLSESIVSSVPPIPPQPPMPPVPPVPGKTVPKAPSAPGAPPAPAAPGLPSPPTPSAAAAAAAAAAAGISSSTGNDGSTATESGSSSRFARPRDDPSHLSAVSPRGAEGSDASAFSAATVTGLGFGYPPLAPTEPLGGLSAAQASTAGLVKAQDVSQALFNQKDNGIIESQDALLEDPFQLYRFFVAHNDKPSMHVLITGSHVEKRTSEKTNSNGTTKTVQQKVKVHDFRMDFDLTPFIKASGTLSTLPDPQSGKRLTLREVMEEHVEDENPFKELHMPKKVNWDYEDLTKAITHAIRSVNYRYTIEISYPITNHMVQVKPSSPLASFMQSNWTKILSVISCFGIVMYPLRAMVKKVKDKTLQSEFEMTVTTREFFLHNYWAIIDHVKYKS